MRLICPNCGAQYEVAEDVIPEAGRDVQCSNCGHTWLEHHGSSEAAEIGTDTPTSQTKAEPEAEVQSEPEVQSEAEADVKADNPVENQGAPEEEAPWDSSDYQNSDQVDAGTEADSPEHAASSSDADSQADDTEHEADAKDDTPQPRELDKGVADILREEADFEKAARVADGAGLEQQADLDLSRDLELEYLDPDEERRGAEASDRLARLRGEPDVSAAVASTMALEAEGPRSELLPNIDEINSTLSGDDDGTIGDDIEYGDEVQPRSRFRRGFMYAVFMALIALAVYIFAPQIIEAVPQLESAITSYVNWVDGLRIALDQRLQGFISTNTDPAEAAVSS